MYDDILRRLKKGVGAHLYGRALATISKLLGVPILLHAWGETAYGYWLLLFAIPGYLSLMDFGFSASAANDMTALVSRGDKRQALAVFQSIFLLICAVSLFGIAVSSIGIKFAPLESWFVNIAIDSSKLRLILWLLCAQVILQLADGLNDAGFRANGNYALHGVLYSTTQFAQESSVWIAALCGGGLLEGAAAFFAVRAGAFLLSMVLMLKLYPWLKLSFACASLSELRRLLRPALANLAMPFSYALNLQGLLLIIGYFLSPIYVVQFATLRTLARVSWQLLASLTSPSEPEFAALSDISQQHMARTIFVHLLRIVIWSGFAFTIGALILGPSFLRLWTNGAVQMQPWLFAWLLLSSFATGLWSSALNVLRGTNQHFRATVAFMFLSVGVIGASAGLLSLSFGLVNVGSCLALVDCAFAAYVLRDVALRFETTLPALLAKVLDPRPIAAVLVRLKNEAW